MKTESHILWRQAVFVFLFFWNGKQNHQPFRRGHFLEVKYHWSYPAELKLSLSQQVGNEQWWLGGVWLGSTMETWRMVEIWSSRGWQRVADWGREGGRAEGEAAVRSWALAQGRCWLWTGFVQLSSGGTSLWGAWVIKKVTSLELPPEGDVVIEIVRLCLVLWLLGHTLHTREYSGSIPGSALTSLLDMTTDRPTAQGTLVFILGVFGES